MKLINLILTIGIFIMATSITYGYGHYSNTCHGEMLTPAEVALEKVCPACKETIGVLNACDQGELECPTLDYEVFERLALSEAKGDVIQQICDVEKALIIKSYESKRTE